MTREERLQYIKVEVYKHTNQKLEDIELAMILGSIIAMENIEESVEKTNAKFSGSTTQNYYSNLDRMTSWKIFLFKWGWGFYIISGLLLLWGTISGYNTYREYQVPAEFDKIHQRKDGKYYIFKKDYTVIKDEGIIINP